MKNQGLGGRQALSRRALPLRGLRQAPPRDQRIAERGGGVVGWRCDQGPNSIAKNLTQISQKWNP